MIVGFTGTQHGMTPPQFETLQRIFNKVRLTELHHGDCVGADAEAHVMAKTKGKKVIGHPPIKSDKRAWCECDELREPAAYLKRNRAIVDATQVLVGCPSTMKEILRSGTWSTIRYALKRSKPVYVILPDGTLTPFNTNTGRKL